MKYILIFLLLYCFPAFAQYDYIIGDLNGNKVRIQTDELIDSLVATPVVTLSDVSDDSDDATKSTYTMTATIPVEFESSDNNTILYLDEANERVTIGGSTQPSLTAPLYVHGTAFPQAVFKLHGTSTSALSGFTLLNFANQQGNFLFNQSTYTPANNQKASQLFMQTNGAGGILLNSANASSTIDFVTNNFAAVGGSILAMRILATGFTGIGTGSADRLFHVEASDAVTNAVTYANRLSHISSGTVAASFGTGTEIELENASNTNRIAAANEYTWSDATNATEDATESLKLMRAGTLTTARTTLSTGFTGFNIAAPVSPLHIYEDNANTDSTVGLTIEQDGAGDALEHFLLSGGQRYTIGIDNSDSDKFKILTSTNDFLEINDVSNTVVAKVLDSGTTYSMEIATNGIDLNYTDGASSVSSAGFNPAGSLVISVDDGTEASVQSQSATAGWGMTVDDGVNFNNVSISAERSQFAGQVAFNSKITATISTDQDDWNPTGLGDCNWIVVDNGANNVAIGGLVAAKFTNGSKIIIQRLGSGTVTLEHEEGTSTAANRFDCAADTDVIIPLWIEIIYDGDLDRWLVNSF